MTYGVLISVLSLALVGVAACGGGEATTGSSTAQASAATTSSAASTSGSGGQGGGGGEAGGGGQGGVGGAGGTASLTLQSPAYKEGEVIPAQYTCSGANISPALEWTVGPAGTLSYAVVLTDRSNDLLHWVIWDIPGDALSLPEAVKNEAEPPVPPGAKQVKSYDGQTFGYLGPCPGTTHTYELAVFALDVATLPGVTTASTRKGVKTAILAHDLATATLTGTFTP